MNDSKLREQAVIDYPDAGYTPANLKVLVAATGLGKADFIKEFALNRAMFYRHQKGDSTMSHSDWQSLKTRAEKYVQDQ